MYTNIASLVKYPKPIESRDKINIVRVMLDSVFIRIVLVAHFLELPLRDFFCLY